MKYKYTLLITIIVVFYILVLRSLYTASVCAFWKSESMNADCSTYGMIVSFFDDSSDETNEQIQKEISKETNLKSSVSNLVDISIKNETSTMKIQSSNSNPIVQSEKVLKVDKENHFFPIHQLSEFGDNGFDFKIPVQSEFFDEVGEPYSSTYPPSSSFDLSKPDFMTFINYYISYQREVIDGIKPKRILCYKANAAGLGNKLLGLYSSLFMAMMTNRAFAICDWPSITDYYEFRFPLLFFREKILRVPRKVVYGPSCGSRPDFKTEPLDTIFKGDISIFQTNCASMDYFVQNPEVQQKLIEIGLWPKNGNPPSYTRRKFETFVAHHLMRPTPIIRNKVLSVLNQRDSDAYYIGIHIRTGNQTDFEVNNPKPFIYDSDIDYMVELAQGLSEQYDNHEKWFISSDSSKVKRRIYSKFPQIVEIYNSTVLHSGGSSFRNAVNGVFDAITETYLLGASDNIIGTRGSTFSYISSLIARKDAIIVGKDQKHNIKLRIKHHPKNKLKTRK